MVSAATTRRRGGWRTNSTRSAPRLPAPRRKSPRARRPSAGLRRSAPDGNATPAPSSCWIGRQAAMYAYMRVSSRRCDEVTFPDGQHELVDEGQGEAAVADWRRAQVARHPDGARLAAENAAEADRLGEERRVRA